MRSLIKNKIVANMGWMMIASIGQMIISIFVNSITARYLGPTNYGIVQYVASFVSMFSPICQMGLYSIVINEIVSKRDQQGEILGTALVIRLAISIISTVSIAILVYCLNDCSKVYLVCAILCSIKLIFDSFEIFKYWFQSRLEAKIITVITLTAYLCMSFFRIALLVLKADVYWFGFATTLDSIIIAMGYSLMYKKSHGQRLKFKWNAFHILMSQSKNLLITAIIGGVASQINTILLNQFIDEVAVAYYTCAIVCCTHVGFIFSAVVDTLRPVLMESYKRSKESFKSLLSLTVSVVFLISIIGVIMFLALGKIVVLVLYGTEYLQAAQYVWIYSIGYFASFIGVIRTIWFVCNEELSVERKITIIVTSASLVFSYFMVKYFGLHGAFISYLISQLVLHVFSSILFQESREFMAVLARGMLFKDIKEIRQLL